MAFRSLCARPAHLSYASRPSPSSNCSVLSPPHQRLARIGSAAGAAGRADGSLDQVSLVSRQLEQAIASEDYPTAARLRDTRKALLEELPPARQILFHQLATLSQPGASVEDRLFAIDTIAMSHDASFVPALADLLGGGDPLISEAAASGMWSLFTVSADPSINELMSQGLRLMAGKEMAGALQVFERLIREAPLFPEGYNKRATVMYMLSRWEESIADCRKVLELQPLHFGAASGIGLCHVKLQQDEEALAAFGMALKIHPGLDNIARLSASVRAQRDKSLRQKQEEEQRAEEEQGQRRRLDQQG